MKKGEVYAISIGAVYRPAHKALRDKYIAAWCYGPSGKTGTGTPFHRFAVGAALFDKVPTLADVRATKFAIHTLLDSHPPGAAAVYDIAGPPIRGVSLIGEGAKIPTLTPKQLRQREWGSWINIALDYNFNWRERHDTAALERARAVEDAKDKKLANTAKAKRRAGGLASLARRTLAPELKGLVSAARAKGVRAILKRAIDELRRAEKQPAKLKRKILESAVQELNRYDDAQGGFIETPEREALMVCLEDIAFASGLGELTKQLNEWRDW